MHRALLPPNALADRVLAGEEGIVERYLTFLQAGGSRYPLDALAAPVLI
ncbi:MAG: oligoendopeptidase F family protein [Chloroflexaceae bacterium]|nr:oligoendopeptidase F family protein [Chloroflexaceae bacterium]